MGLQSVIIVALLVQDSQPLQPSPVLRPVLCVSVDTNLLPVVVVVVLLEAVKLTKTSNSLRECVQLALRFFVTSVFTRRTHTRGVGSDADVYSLRKSVVADISEQLRVVYFLPCNPPREATSKSAFRSSHTFTITEFCEQQLE